LIAALRCLQDRPPAEHQVATVQFTHLTVPQPINQHPARNPHHRSRKLMMETFASA